MIEKLKPCPFCGGEAKIVHHKFFSEVVRHWEDGGYSIECKNCHASGYQLWSCEKQASKAWNRRVSFNERIKGEWILEREPDGTPYCFHCSVCDKDFHHIGIKTAYDFCPNCGADMRKEKTA